MAAIPPAILILALSNGSSRAYLAIFEIYTLVLPQVFLIPFAAPIIFLVLILRPDAFYNAFTATPRLDGGVWMSAT